MGEVDMVLVTAGEDQSRIDLLPKDYDTCCLMLG
jgi:hypothetical protein